MNNSKEVWKDIQGYEGYYQVSNTGRVRSCDREIVFKDGRRGYEQTSVSKCAIGKLKTYKGYVWKYI